MGTISNPTGNKISELTTTGPCMVDTHTYGCVLAAGCDDVAIIGTGAGVCHLQGRATVTGSFSFDVSYYSCVVRCSGAPAFVTDHYGEYLSDSMSADSGTSGN